MMTIWESNKKLVKETLYEYNGNRKRTAESLGISVRTLANYIERIFNEDKVFFPANENVKPLYHPDNLGHSCIGMASNEERLYYLDNPEKKVYRNRNYQ